MSSESVGNLRPVAQSSLNLAVGFTLFSNKSLLLALVEVGNSPECVFFM